MSRARTLSLVVALVVLTAALAACGGGGSDDPQSVVDEATLQGIESGKIDLSLNVNVKGEKSGKVDVSLSGPFQSESEAELPELDLSFATRGSLGGERLDREGGFTLLGNKAYVAYEGTEYEVDSTTFNFVKSLLKQQVGGQDQSNELAACQEAVSDVELADLVENLKDEGSADVDGTSTTKVSGDLNAAGAAGVFSELVDDPACSEQLSTTGSLPSAAELDKAKSTVRNSVKSAHVELYVGDDDIVQDLGNGDGRTAEELRWVGRTRRPRSRSDPERRQRGADDLSTEQRQAAQQPLPQAGHQPDRTSRRLPGRRRRGGSRQLA